MLRVLAFLLFSPALLYSVAVKLTVQDPDGAAVPGAAIRMEPVNGGAASTATSDAAGTVTSLNPTPGEYLLTVQKPGFGISKQGVTVKADEPLSMTIGLKVGTQQTSVQVSGKISAMANSDPNYRALRAGVPGKGVRVENLQLTRDVGTFTFKSGEFLFAPSVLGKTVMAVFTGEGSFRLKPQISVETNHLKLVTGQAEVDEQFRSVVFCFTDGSDSEIRKAGFGESDGTAGSGAFQEFRRRVRHRGDEPRSLLEALIGLENIPNVDADLLGELYSGRRPSFTAFIHGRKYADLRFIVSSSGALPQIAPEEVALINHDTGGEQDGVLYLSHLASEWAGGRASSNENRRWVSPLHYQIETAIGSNDHLGGICKVRLKVLVENTRVIKFGLLPSLRVTAVKLAGNEIGYIQEGRKEDGSFYVVLPQAAKAGSEVELIIDYEGDKVVTKAGGGSFAVDARESWFPSLNAFAERATFDLTFRVPKRYSLVSVGRMEKTWREQEYQVSHWVSEIPLAVAGFNFGDYKKLSQKDEATSYDMEVWSTSEVPDYLRGRGSEAMSPSAMAKNAMADAENSMRIFGKWFGPLPYGRLAITQQPQFNFGQSWPSLIYLPLSAFLDSTQRWMLMGSNAFRFAEFVDEVTPHEVSHQWWGHAVGWASYRDQWLSEGFADFSAGLFLQASGKPDAYVKYLERQREQVIEKNAFGLRANDVGPLWMGLRLGTFKYPRAYSKLVYPKGGLVLHMLRGLMWDPKTFDDDFIKLMRDFVTENFNRAASTEDFRAAVEKHMKPSMDMTGNGSMDWFFAEWVYGTELPRYRLDYSVQQEAEGTFLLTGKVTQSDVGSAFQMKVPIYAEFDNRVKMRLGSAGMVGNSTSPEFKIRLPKRPKRVMANAFYDVLAAETVNQEAGAKK